MHGSLLAAMPLSEAQYGLLTSSLFWAYGLAAPFAGLLADRCNRAWVVTASLLLWSGITWVASQCRSFEALIILRSLMGASEACYMPAALSLICDYHRGPTRSLAVGLQQTGVAAGIGLSGLGGRLAEIRGWQYAFGLVGLAGVAYAVVLALCLRDAPRTRPSPAPAAPGEPKPRLGATLLTLSRSGAFALAFVSSALIGVCGWTIYGWAPVFLQERFHLTQGVAGLSATGYMQAAAFPGLILGGIWADRWSRNNRRGRMYVAALGMAAAAPGVLLAAHGHLLGLAILGLVIYRLGAACLGANSMPILCEIVESRQWGLSYGIYDLIGTFAAGLGVYLSGVLRDRAIGLTVAFDVVAALLVVNAAVLYFIRPKRPERRGDAP